MPLSRRHFLRGAVASTLAISNVGAQASFQFGYDAASWDDQIDQAATEIAELGYRAIQVRQNTFSQFSVRAGELKAMLAAKKLTLLALAARGASFNPPSENWKLRTSPQKPNGCWMSAVNTCKLWTMHVPQPQCLIPMITANLANI